MDVYYKGKQVSIGSNKIEIPESYDFSSLEGKYCLAIGDSYTYQMCSGGPLSDLNTEIGMAGTLNHGIVSATFRDRKNSSNGYAYKPIVCRVLNQNSTDTSGNTITGEYIPLDRDDIGYITLMGGTNDSYGYPSSTGDNPLTSDITTIIGAVNMTVQKLVEAYPDVPILLMTEPEYSKSEFTAGVNSVLDFTGTYDAEHASDTSGIKNGYVLGAMVAHRKQKMIYDAYKFWADAYPNVYLLDFCLDWYHVANPNDAKYWRTDDERLHMTGAGYTELVRGTRYNSILTTLKQHFRTDL